MRTNRGVRSVTLVLFLIPVLAFLGSNAAEAKKKPKPPPPTQWNWQVEIPPCWGSNMCAEGENTYADTGAEDGVWVDVTKTGSRGGTESQFGFAVFKCEPGEACYPNDTPDRVTLWGIELDQDWVLDEGPPCEFPLHPNPGASCPDTNPAGCMECFVNGRHPYWGGDNRLVHDLDNRYFSFDLTVRGDFNEIEIGETVVSSGHLTMELFNTRDILVNGDEDDHFVYSHVDLPGDSTGYIEIERLTKHSWQVAVSVNEVGKVDPRMLVVEGYVGCWKLNRKNKCVWEYKWPIWARTSSQLTFQAIWTGTPAE